MVCPSSDPGSRKEWSMSLSYSNGSGILQRVLFKKANRVAQATDARWLLSTFRQPYLVQFTVFLVAYCIAGKLGQATANIRSSNLGPVWPAYGIALAAFLVCGYRVWPAIALGAFLIAFFRVCVTWFCPITASNVPGRYFLAETMNFSINLNP